MNNFVIIPVKNQLHYTQGLLKQLYEQNEDDVTIIMDNGSTDGTQEWLASQAVVVLDMPGANIHQMWNAGLDKCRELNGPGLYNVAILNNDLWIGPHFISSLADVLRSNANIGIVGPNYDERPFPAEVDCFAVNTLCNGRYDGTGGFPGFAFMLKGDDRYRFPDDLHWWFGDADLLKTTLSWNKMAVITKHAVCKHLDGGGRTGNWSDPEMRKLTLQDQERYQLKWGNKTSPMFKRQKII